MGREPVSLKTPIGIKIRTDREIERIQIAFSFEGQQCRELLPVCKINKTNIDYAASLRSEIRRKITDGVFEYAKYFPDSPKVTKGVVKVVQKLSIGDLLRAQLAIYDKQTENDTLSPSSYQGYYKIINSILIPAFDKLPINDLTAPVLRTWIAGLGVTAKTVRNRLTPLRSALEDALNDDLIESNPLDNVALKKLLSQTSTKSKRGAIEPFDHEEVAALLKACRADERSTLQFWFATGLRPGEFIALRWESIDMDKKLVRISTNEVTGRRGDVVGQFEKAPKTSSGAREIDLSVSAIEALAQQQELKHGDNSRVWMNPRSGKPWAREQQIVRTFWEPLFERSKIRYRNLYQIRHTYASTLLTNGANPFWLAQQMGHVDAEMVFKRYGKWIPKNFQKSLPSAYGNSE